MDEDESKKKRIQALWDRFDSSLSEMEKWGGVSRQIVGKANATGLLATLAFGGGVMGASEDGRLPFGVWLIALAFLAGLVAWGLTFFAGPWKHLKSAHTMIGALLEARSPEAIELEPHHYAAPDLQSISNMIWKTGIASHIAAWVALAIGTVGGMILLLFYTL